MPLLVHNSYLSGHSFYCQEQIEYKKRFNIVIKVNLNKTKTIQTKTINNLLLVLIKLNKFEYL